MIPPLPRSGRFALGLRRHPLVVRLRMQDVFRTGLGIGADAGRKHATGDAGSSFVEETILP